MKLIYKIHSWSTSKLYDNPYLSPEANPLCLVGTVDSKIIRTSPIVHADGRTITTRSGSTYLLQEPDPDFVLFCKSNNIPLDLDNPITLIIYK